MSAATLANVRVMMLEYLSLYSNGPDVISFDVIFRKIKVIQRWRTKTKNSCLQCLVEELFLNL